MAKGPIKYTQEVIKEGKRVRWPKRDVLVPMIITVVIIALFFGVFLALEDYAAGSLIQQLQSLFEGIIPDPTPSTTETSSSSAAAAVGLIQGLPLHF